MTGSPILSRHRLPSPYRPLLIALWLTPIGLLLIAILIGNGMTAALFDPRLLLPLGMMALPALYVWQEGVDVLRDGIVRRVYWPRYYPYHDLQSWRLQRWGHTRILIIRDVHRCTVLSRHTDHLTDFPTLLDALRSNVGHIH